MRGVYFKNMKWQAAIKVEKKQIHLGTVGSQEEAARLYDRCYYCLYWLLLSHLRGSLMSNDKSYINMNFIQITDLYFLFFPPHINPYQTDSIFQHCCIEPTHVHDFSI